MMMINNPVFKKSQISSHQMRRITDFLVWAFSPEVHLCFIYFCRFLHPLLVITHSFCSLLPPPWALSLWGCCKWSLPDLGLFFFLSFWVSTSCFLPHPAPVFRWTKWDFIDCWLIQQKKWCLSNQFLGAWEVWACPEGRNACPANDFCCPHHCLCQGAMWLELYSADILLSPPLSFSLYFLASFLYLSIFPKLFHFPLLNGVYFHS